MILPELAERLRCRLEGDDGESRSRRVAGIEQARPGDLTFVANAKYLAQLATTRASAIIVGRAVRRPRGGSAAILRSGHPYLAFAQAVSLLIARRSAGARRRSPRASMAADATLGADVSIGPFVAIGAGASIGARTVIYPNVVIGPGARIGEDCVIHSHVSVREARRRSATASSCRTAR